jgi:D-alanyl-D-alanine carboxypeptidase (penicillin-binding protein 5/6)
MFVEVGKQVSVEQLMQGVIIQSGNDATIALAEYLAGTEEAFASVMNQYGELLGMKNSHFINSTGLPHADHYSTPRDLAFLTQALIRDFPEHYQWYAVKEMTYNNIKQTNRNRLLWRNQDIDGVKTGHTESAGYCLVASALRDNMRLISVVLGTQNEKAREQTSLQLLNYGFRFFETPKLVTRQDVLVDARLWKGAESTVPLGIDADLYVTVPRGSAKQLQTRVTHKKHLIAPLAKGAALGKVTVSLDDKILAEREVIAMKDAQPGGFWKRLFDSIRIFISRLFST